MHLPQFMRLLARHDSRGALLRSAIFSGLTGAGRVLERGSALLHYAAAGTVRIDELHGAIQRQWEQFGEGADDLERGLTTWEKDLYGRHIRKGERVLVIGCGTGRDLLALLGAGHRADGIDFAGVEVARREVRARGYDSTVIEGAIDRTELREAYDVFVLSWYCYECIPESSRRVRTLQRLEAHLRPSGRILISLPPPWFGPRKIYGRVARAASWLSRSDWRPERGDSLFVASNAAVFPRYSHAFPPGELEEEVARAGLQVADSFVGNGGTRCYAVTR
jgi:SAM-dependent methyltransferase